MTTASSMVGEAPREVLEDARRMARGDIPMGRDDEGMNAEAIGTKAAARTSFDSIFSGRLRLRETLRCATVILVSWFWPFCLVNWSNGILGNKLPFLGRYSVQPRLSLLLEQLSDASVREITFKNLANVVYQVFVGWWLPLGCNRH